MKYFIRLILVIVSFIAVVTLFVLYFNSNMLFGDPHDPQIKGRAKRKLDPAFNNLPIAVSEH